MDHSEPKAGALIDVFRGEEWRENFRLNLFAHPRTRIAHRKKNAVRFATGLDRHGPPLRHRL